jgi:hypothetical protein
MSRIEQTATPVNRDARTIAVTTCDRGAERGHPGGCAGLLIVGDKFGNVISTHLAEGERLALIEALGGRDA